LPAFAIDLSHPDFRNDAKRAGKRHPSLLKEDLPKLIDSLKEQPEIGDRISGLSAEVRKARVGVRQQNLGPRGAYRLIYRVNRETSVLQPLALYYKPDLPDLPLRAVLNRLANG
jgi:mRNA-degrading endonuclease RelE of RelBE toxin-antitoxin system